MKTLSTIFTAANTKKLALASALALITASNAMAFSETEFRSALKQLIATPTVSQEQRVAASVTAWLNQDYINSLGQIEIDAASKASQTALSSFSNLLKQEPNNPLLLSYTGAATAKSSLEKFVRGEKNNALEDGTAMVEQALRLADEADKADYRQAMHGSVPVALEVRFVAASTYLAVPKVMNRNQQGQQLLKDVLEAQQFAQSDLFFRGAVWMRAASLAMEQQRPDDAKNFLNEVVKHNAPQARSASELLQKLS
ncbi:hypothetical protein [Undibacterium sp. TJN19]|uniref:hypothetical protein n=1 Tax=Undibacterium sp. TJN19 TaxID=3413055 RepID=UPI003BEFA418